MLCLVVGCGNQEGMLGLVVGWDNQEECGVWLWDVVTKKECGIVVGCGNQELFFFLQEGMLGLVVGCGNQEGM